MRTRIAIGGVGVLLGLFGVFRLVTEISLSDLFVLVIWLAGAVLIHDGILSPIVVGVGVALERVPPRARQFVQAALIAAALVTVIALPLIHREGTQPASKAILQRNYSGGLLLLLGVITAVAVLAYVARLLRDRRTPPHARRPRPHPDPGPDQRPSTTNSRPPEDQSSITA